MQNATCTFILVLECSFKLYKQAPIQKYGKKSSAIIFAAFFVNVHESDEVNLTCERSSSIF